MGEAFAGPGGQFMVEPPVRGSRGSRRIAGSLLLVVFCAGEVAGAGERWQPAAPVALGAAVPMRFRVPLEPGWWSLGSLPAGRAPAPPAAVTASPRAFPGADLSAATRAWSALQGARGPDGLRLLNLWHGRENALSLQAGRRGEAQLQWTSHPFGTPRDERGVIEHLFDAGPAGRP